MEPSILNIQPDVIDSLYRDLSNLVRGQPQEIYEIAKFVIHLPRLRDDADLFTQLLLYPHALIELVKLQLSITGALPRDQKLKTEYVILALEIRQRLVQHLQEHHFDNDYNFVILSATNRMSELALENKVMPKISLRQTPTFRRRYASRLNERLARLEPVRWPLMDNRSLALNCLAEEVLSNGHFQAMPNPGTLLDNLRCLREVYNTVEVDRNALLRSVETSLLQDAGALSQALSNAGLTIFSDCVNTDRGVWDIFTQNHWDWRAGIQSSRSDRAAALYRLRAETRRLDRLAGFATMPNTLFHDYIFQIPWQLELHQDSLITYVNENPNAADRGGEVPGNHASFSPPDDTGSDDGTSGIDFEKSCVFCTAQFLAGGANEADLPSREPPRTFACGHTVGAVCWADWTGLPRCPFCSAPV